MPCPLSDRPDAYDSGPEHGPDDDHPVTVLRITSQQAGRPHSHSHCELVLILGGGGEHLTDAGRWPVAAGDVFVIEPGYHHCYDNVDRLHLMNLLIRPLEDWFRPFDLAREPGWHALFTLEPRMRAQHNFRSRLRLRDADLRRATELVDAMEEEQRRAAPGWGRGLASRFGLLVECLIRAREHSGGGERRELLRLADTLAAIERDPAHPWAIEELCAIAHCSPSTLQRSFNRAVGMPPINWILGRRIDAACHALRTSTASVTSIALDCGFDDSNYFSRQFRRTTDMSPTAYRRRFANA